MTSVTDISAFAEIIRWMRKQLPEFENRVAGMADARHWQLGRAQDSPFAFLRPIGVATENRIAGTSNWRRKSGNFLVRQDFALHVYICSAGDERNQDAISSIDKLSMRIMSTLEGWQPRKEYSPIQVVSIDVAEQTAEYSGWIFLLRTSRQWAHACNADLCETPEQRIERLTGQRPRSASLNAQIIADACDPCASSKDAVTHIDLTHCPAPCDAEPA